MRRGKREKVEERVGEGEEEVEMLGGNNGPMEVRLLSTSQSYHCSASQGEESVRWPER